MMAQFLTHCLRGYCSGTQDYDTSEKRRSPAWCDRVLWRTPQPQQVQTLHYQRYETMVSDHRPISAAFDVQVKTIDPVRQEKVLRGVESLWKVKEKALLETMQDFYTGQ